MKNLFFACLLKARKTAKKNWEKFVVAQLRCNNMDVKVNLLPDVDATCGLWKRTMNNIIIIAIRLFLSLYYSAILY